MMDLRYHLASLMSVFLALAVGIVVGVSLGSSERQAATIQRLQQDFAAIRVEDKRIQEVNAGLQRRLQAREAAERELLPLAVRGRLAGNRIALLLTGDAAPALETPLTETLRLAGADVAVTVRLPRGENSRRLSGASAENERGTPPEVSDSPSEAERVATALTRALITGQAGLLEGVLARSPDLEVTGELRAPIRRLLLFCPNQDPEYARQVAASSGVEASVARVARELDALLVAAEPEAWETAEPQRRETRTDMTLSPQEPTSLLPALAGLGATTIDNVDTAAGQIAAVLALGGARGRFGTGSGATRPLPPIQGR
jgi:hypothetical protein